MQWLRNYFIQYHRNYVVRTSAEKFFTQNYPKDKVIWSVIAWEDKDSSIIGITYRADFIPPPYRFFRVLISDFSVIPMDEGYWPPNWGLYR
jgi:hypothetical protein